MNDNCPTHVAPSDNPVDVLVVNDTLDDLCTVERILEKEGYEVRRVDDVHRTLAKVRDLLPGVLLLDAEMRSVDGIQICKALKAQPETAAIPVVFMMAHDALECLPGVYEAGGTAFIVKPIQQDNLLTTVGTQFELLRARNIIQQYDEVVQQHSDQLAAPDIGVNLDLRQDIEGFFRSGLFRSLIEQSPIAIELLSPNGQIRQVNAAWQRLWDITDEETGQVLAKYNMLTDKQVKELGIASQVERAFAGEPVVLPPIQYHGSIVAEEIGLANMRLQSPWIQCHLYPITDADGHVIFVVNNYIDITELKKAEQDAREQREALARVGRATMMGQLTASIAHELNQPLTGILSNAKAAEIMILREQYDQEELVSIMTDIASDARRAGELIRNLRGLYREQKGDFQSVDINAVIEDTLKLLHSEFVIRGVKISTRLPSSSPRVNGNWILIQQVLVNLIMNGLEATKGIVARDRQLRVTATNDVNQVRVWVEDHGVGIDEALIDRIFEPLATWKPEGTGMGLAISDSIIKRHGGRMWAENRIEGGARVGFSLPVAEE